MNDQCCSILLAEDDENDAILMQRALRNAGHDKPVRVVRDGEEAVAALSELCQSPCRGDAARGLLVLLDLKLPRKTGLEVLEWVRSQPDLRRVPVVLLTSSRDPRDVRRAYDLGVNSYLVKPSGYSELVELAKLLVAYWFGLNEHPELAPGRND